MKSARARIAFLICSVAFNIILAKGNLKWIPDWIPLIVMVIAGAYWMLTDPDVRSLLPLSFERGQSTLVHHTTGRPLELPRKRVKRGVVTLVILVPFVIGTGVVTWKFRGDAIKKALEPPAPMIEKPPVIAVLSGPQFMSRSFIETFFWEQPTATREVTPINYLAFLNITNLRVYPTRLKNISFEIRGSAGQWWPMKNLPTHQAIWSHDIRYPKQGTTGLALEGGFLLDNATEVDIDPQRTISGWVLCQLPADYYVSDYESMSAIVRIHITDVAGDEISKLLEVEQSNLTSALIHPYPVREEFSNYKVMPYGGN